MKTTTSRINYLKAALIAAFVFIMTAGASLPAGASTAGATAKQTITKNKVKKSNPASATGSSASTFEAPDFAFPETVEKDAVPYLEKALKDGNGVEALRAAIQIIVARNLVSKSSVGQNVALLDSIAGILPQPYAGLCSLLEANLYQQVYNREQWTFNNRTLPLDSYPEDVMSWSGDLMAKKVSELVEASKAAFPEAGHLPISALEGVLTDVKEAAKVGFTVADFMVCNSESVLNRFVTHGTPMVIPFRRGEEKRMLNVREKCQEEASQLLDEAISGCVASGRKAPLCVFIVKKAESLDGEEKIHFLSQWQKELASCPDVARIIFSRFEASQRLDFIGGKESVALYKDVREWLRSFGDSPYAPSMRYVENTIKAESGRVSVPDRVLPMSGGKGKVRMSNLNDMYVLIYKVPESMIKNGGLVAKNFPGSSKCVKTIQVKSEGSVPFSSEKEFEIPALPSGAYVAVPSATPRLSSKWSKEVERWSLGFFRVTDIAIITLSNSLQKGSAVAYVVDAATQRPLSGIAVEFYDNGRGKLIKSGVTGKDGSFMLPENYGRMIARRGDNISELWYGTHYGTQDKNMRPGASILTDLAIYKPGQEVRFSLVGWTSDDKENTLLRECGVKVTLRDANGNKADTLRLTTDRMGRCNGSFRLPADGLLGTCSLLAEFDVFTGQTVGFRTFQVADYKTPTFFVEIEKDSLASYSAGDTLRFSGEVKTYSGMPLGGSEVSYNIRWTPWWRWWGGSTPDATYGGSLIADEQGKFTIELPTDNLKGTRFERGIYTIEARATSSSGETQEAPSFRFSLGADYTVSPDIPEKIAVEGDDILFKVPVYDMLGLPVVKNVGYKIENLSDGKELMQGVFASPALKVDAARIPSGKYRLTFSVEGDTLETQSETVVYRQSDTKAPYATSLWLPVNEVVATDGAANATVEVGSGYTGSWILCVVSGENGIIRKEWIEMDGDNRKVNVAVPAKGETLWVSFSGMHDLDQTTGTVTVVPASSRRKLAVKTTSFRNRLTAGDKEEWTFTFDIDGKPVADIPAFAVMTDKALNALVPFSWNLSARKGYVGLSTDLSRTGIGMLMASALFTPRPKYEYPFRVDPQWDSYDCGLAGGGSLRIRGRAMMKAAADGAVVYEGVVDQMATGAVEEEVLTTVQLTSRSLDADGGLALSENAVEGAAVPEPSGAPHAEKPELRPVEMPVAFFMPELTGDADGNVTVKFETPDFNTTWQFQIAAYTEDMLTATRTLEAVASKPVMVSSNPPRFLRTGDRGSVAASLFNNTEADCRIAGRIELTDAMTGRVLESRSFAAEYVAPSGHRAVTLDFEVPSGISAIAVRAYAETDRFSDGEQTVVAVLPSSTPVIESTEFYLKPGEGNFEVRLPKYKDDANITLKYCDNPVWECVTALPSISTPESKNILSLMKALFSNSMALEIADRYPAVRTGIEKALGSKDSVLYSKLEKDASLKNVALGNTPWVNNASSETARMMALSTLLDKSGAEAAISSIGEQVKSLQNADGGWSWCPDMRSSEFMTRNVIALFGRMKQGGCDISGYDRMIKKGVAYCDKTMYDSYVKAGKKFSVTDVLGYLYARGFFDKGDGKSGFGSLKKEALKRISEEWSGFTIYNKALAAIVMSESKGYERTAGVILESLNQYASKDGQKGWWFDNLNAGFDGMPKLLTTATVLEAYAAIEPKAEAVDGLRQWLVLQKETEDWGADSYTVEVISAILASGSDWTASSSAPDIKLDGKPLSLPAGECLTGTFTLNLDRKSASGKRLEISKSSAGPAWGGVISQYVAPIKDVKSEDCLNLKIKKELLVVTDTPSGEKVEAKEIKVGDKVRVTLTLTCDKDMDYVALVDERAACLEPAGQLSGYSAQDGLWFYKEVRDTRTSFFIGFLPKGVNVISYDCYADRQGDYSLGIANVQSLYSPVNTAHSSGATVTVK